MEEKGNHRSWQLVSAVLTIPLGFVDFSDYRRAPACWKASHP